LTDSYALRAALVSTLGRSRALLLKPPRPLRGSSDPADADLRAQVRRALRDGVLPQPVNQVWAGAGSGNLCSVCALVIGATEIEYEMLHARGGGERVSVHLSYFLLWQEEAATLREGARSDGDGHDPS
jgi:hypothetical protein